MTHVPRVRHAGAVQMSRTINIIEDYPRGYLEPSLPREVGNYDAKGTCGE